MVFGFLVVAALALIPAAIANNKGRSFFGWWLYGFLIWIVALPHSILLRQNGIAAQSASPLPAGDAQRKTHGWRTAAILAGVLVAGIIIVAFWLGPSRGGISQASASTKNRPASDSSEPAEPVALQVSAEKLYTVYQSNEVAADQIYKGKLLAVSGVVRSINKDFLNHPYLDLASSNEFDGVQAHLKVSEESKAAALSKGDSITVLCTGWGMVLDSPMLADCVVQANPSQGAPAQATAPALSNASIQATSLPRELWGAWSITRALPGNDGVVPCTEGFETAMIGTQIEYSPAEFRWKDTIVNDPKATRELVGASDLSSKYRTNVEKLGFGSSSISEVSINHPAANLTGATTEIPGDLVFVQGPDTIILNVCGDWFEAQLASSNKIEKADLGSTPAQTIPATNSQ